MMLHQQEIDVDGANIKKVSQKDLHKKIGFVPQKGLLFSGTIESNIKFGSNVTDEQMKKLQKDFSIKRIHRY